MNRKKYIPTWLVLLTYLDKRATMINEQFIQIELLFIQQSKECGLITINYLVIYE